MPRRCSPRPGSWTPPRVMTRWTCSPTLLGGLLARADRAGTPERLRTCPGWTGPPRATPRRCQGPARPAGQRPTRACGTRSAARCLARSSPPPGGRPALLNNQGVATGSWGAAQSPTTSIAESGVEAEQSKFRSSRASAVRIGPTRLGTQGGPNSAIAAATSASAAGAGLPVGSGRYRSAFYRPAAGWPGPATRPGSGPGPTSGSTRTANSQRRSRMDRNLTRGYPAPPPVTPGHTPSATSAMPGPESPSTAAPPSRVGDGELLRW